MRKTLFVVAIAVAVLVSAYAAVRPASPAFAFGGDCPDPPCPPIAATK
jgi:hypothetical protein